MCPQSPSELVQQYRRLQRLLLNEERIEVILEDIKDIPEQVGAGTGPPTEEEEQKCEDFIDKLGECKFCCVL